MSFAYYLELLAKKGEQQCLSKPSECDFSHTYSLFDPPSEREIEKKTSLLDFPLTNEFDETPSYIELSVGSQLDQSSLPCERAFSSKLEKKHSHCSLPLHNELDQKTTPLDVLFSTELHKHPSSVERPVVEHPLTCKLDHRPSPFDHPSSSVGRRFYSFDIQSSSQFDQEASPFHVSTTNNFKNISSRLSNPSARDFDQRYEAFNERSFCGFEQRPSLDMSNDDDDVFLPNDDYAYWSAANTASGSQECLPSPQFKPTFGSTNASSRRSSSSDSHVNHFPSRLLRNNDNYATVGNVLGAIQDMLQNADPNAVLHPDYPIPFRATEKYCSLCKKNGETYEFYSTHVLKDGRGKVICPILRKYTCPNCGANGDTAHTLRHCPVTKAAGQTSATEVPYTRRSSHRRRF